MVEPTPSEKNLPLHKAQCVFVSWENGRHLHILETVYLIPRNFCAIYLTIILRNRAEYHLILSRRGRRPSWLNQTCLGCAK